MDKTPVLIIEDETSVCELLLACLTKEGYRVSVAQNGEAALLQIEEDPPAAVVLDLNLPGMSGLDVCRVMRRDRWMGRIPVLMLTGKAEEEDIVTGLEVGADDYMTKPFSPKLLAARVKALLRRGDNQQQTAQPVNKSVEAVDSPPPLLVKTLGNSELVFDDRRLSWTEEFSPAQRQLMSMLVGTPSGKVSQEEIQLALWPESSPARARSSFDSLLSRVRRTLEQTLDPFDSKQYLVVKRGYLYLEHTRIDAHEFSRLIRKGNQQFFAREFWPAEITYSSAFSLWQGAFVPGDFGSDTAIVFQDELEQLYLENSLHFARLMAEKERYQQGTKLLRDALRYDPANDAIVRLLYQFALAQDNLRQASNILKQYREALVKDHLPEQEIEKVLRDFPNAKPEQGWLAVA